MVDVSTKIPKFTLLSTFPARQKKGSVVIFMQPAAYKAKPGYTAEVKTKDYAFAEQFIRSTDSYNVTVKKPFLAPNPTHVQFNVVFKNQMKRILRLEGVVIRVKGDKENVAFEGEKHAKFSSDLVLPGETKNITLYGPPLNFIADSSKVVIDFFDIPVSLDRSGQTKDKAKFTWVYGVNFEPVTKKLALIEESDAKTIKESVLGH